MNTGHSGFRDENEIHREAKPDVSVCHGRDWQPALKTHEYMSRCFDCPSRTNKQESSLPRAALVSEKDLTQSIMDDLSGGQRYIWLWLKPCIALSFQHDAIGLNWMSQ